MRWGGIPTLAGGGQAQSYAIYKWLIINQLAEFPGNVRGQRFFVLGFLSLNFRLDDLL